MIAWILTLALGAELTLDDVLGAVDTRVPKVAEAVAKRRAAEAKAMAARGAFDPKAAAKAKRYEDGIRDYDRTLVEAYLSARTILGPEVSGGYRYGVGEFPSYDGGYTYDDGEVFASLDAPLLDGLLYGDARVARQTADLELLAAVSAADLQIIEARRKAAESYWKWVAAGRGLAVEQSILDLAEQRTGMFRRQQEEGSRPEIDVLDNERVLFERRASWMAAQQKLQVAGVELSLWWRDEQGRPQVPDLALLPDAWQPMPDASELDADLERALARPDVAAARAAMEASEWRRRAAGNARLPDLNASGELIYDLEQQKTELIGQVELGSSLLLRKERGSYDAAAADLQRAEASLRGIQDRVRADVLAAHAVRDTALQRVEAARGAVDRATRVLQMERRRVELGGADLFQLLQRESNLEKDRKALVEAELQLRLAEAAVQAAVGWVDGF